LIILWMLTIWILLTKLIRGSIFIDILIFVIYALRMIF